MFNIPIIKLDIYLKFSIDISKSKISLNILKINLYGIMNIQHEFIKNF
jgi:hypothetical protein